MNKNEEKKNTGDEELKNFKPKQDLDSVIELILRLPWRDNEDFILKVCLMLLCTARYNDMECIAIVMAALKNNGKR